MKLSDLPKSTKKNSKRVGRGYGSGRGGHTSTRGDKGQRSRGKIGLFFEGTKIKKSLLKRLPLFRGKGKFKSRQPLLFVINLKYLNVFKEQEEVSVRSLKEKGLLAKDFPVSARIKVLGDGEIKVPLTVLIPTSKGAKQKIEKAGGRVVEPNEGSKTKKAEEKREEPMVRPRVVKKKNKPTEGR